MPPSISPVVVHATALAVLFLTGAWIAAGFDLARAARRVFAPGGVAAHALDAALVVAVLPLAALGLLLADWGQVRFYTVLGLAGGVAAYRGLASPVLLRAEIAVLRWGARRQVFVRNQLLRVWRCAAAATRRSRRGIRRAIRWLREGWRRPPTAGKPPVDSAGPQGGRTNGARRRFVRGL